MRTLLTGVSKFETISKFKFTNVQNNLSGAFEFLSFEFVQDLVLRASNFDVAIMFRHTNGPSIIG